MRGVIDSGKLIAFSLSDKSEQSKRTNTRNLLIYGGMKDKRMQFRDYK